MELHDTLGFNFFWDGYTYNEMAEMGDSGMVAICQRLATDSTLQTDSLAVYTNYNYIRIGMAETDTIIRMYGGANCGGYFVDGVWTDSGSASLLFGPHAFNRPCVPEYWSNNYIKFERKYNDAALPDDREDVINYNVDLKVKIDSIGSDVPVCTLKVASRYLV